MFECALLHAELRKPAVYGAGLGEWRMRMVGLSPAEALRVLCCRDVCIYDVRCLTAKQNKPVSSLRGHTKSVASAYFSPVTGSRVVTVCADNKLR